jgi:thioredoxin-like negative regulator of GroEL
MTSALVLTLLLAGSANDKGLQWETDFGRAMEQAREENKPVLVDFWAEWCGWCHRLDRTTYADPVVGAMGREFVAVRVNTEGDPRDVKVAERYGVINLPTILFLSPRGRQVLRVKGFQGPGRFPQTMERAMETAQRVMAWEEALEKEPGDAAALFLLGQHLFDQECYEDSYALLARAAAHDGERPAAERRRTRLLLAILQNVHQQYAEAESLIKEALSLDPQAPDQPKLLFILGRTYVSWGRRDEGVQMMEEIVNKHPKSPLAQKARETLFILEKK